MDNDPDDDDSTVEFPPVGGEGTVEFPLIEEDGGPTCGTAVAATYFLATFNDDTGVQFVERHCCCFRHVPRPAEVLPPGAQLIEVVLEDARVRTVVRNGQPEAEITINSGVTILIPADLK